MNHIALEIVQRFLSSSDLDFDYLEQADVSGHPLGRDSEMICAEPLSL